MFTFEYRGLTIKCDTAAELASVAEHIEKSKVHGSLLRQLVDRVESLQKEIDTLRAATAPGKERGE